MTDSGGKDFVRLYWAMRMGMAIIWIWTAASSWFFFPHAESLAWLQRLGLAGAAEWMFVGACGADLLMGFASCLFASRNLWRLQFALVLFYSVAIAIFLPEFLVHPFGPISKNLAVLGCLVYLDLMERRRTG